MTSTTAGSETSDTTNQRNRRDPNRRQTIVTTYRSLGTVAATADALGIDHSLVRYHLKHANEPMNPRGGRTLSEEAKTQTLAVYETHNQDLEATAQELGLSTAATRDRLRKAGIRFERSAIGEDQHESVIAAFRRGDTYGDIADAHGASVSAVKRLLRRLGEPPRFRRPDLAEKFAAARGEE